jgi:hypothetical protein
MDGFLERRKNFQIAVDVPKKLRIYSFFKLVKQISYPGRTVPNPIKVLFGSLKIVCSRKEWIKWSAISLSKRKNCSPPSRLALQEGIK